MIGCAAIILTGLSFKEKEKYLNFGLSLLKKIINFSFDNQGFPKSRNIRQLIFFLKYFVLIREWLKESQNDIPEYLDEIIFYLGQSYSLVWQGVKKDILFNGNHETDNKNFDQYLNSHGYKFTNNSFEAGGYVILKNKKIALVMDIGSSPEKKFSKNYQCGALSFEIISNNNKLICNSGYFQKIKHKLNDISKSSANHSTLIIDNHSSCKINPSNLEIVQELKILKKKVIMEKNYWSICSSHDGYSKRYGIIHERQIEFFPENNKFIFNFIAIKKFNANPEEHDKLSQKIKEELSRLENISLTIQHTSLTSSEVINPEALTGIQQIRRLIQSPVKFDDGIYSFNRYDEIKEKVTNTSKLLATHN